MRTSQGRMAISVVDPKGTVRHVPITQHPSGDFFVSLQAGELNAGFVLFSVVCFGFFYTSVHGAAGYSCTHNRAVSRR